MVLSGKREYAVPKRLRGRFAALMAVVIMVAGLLFLCQNQLVQDAAVESKVLAEARTLNTEMQAVWDYVDDSQNAINYNADGSFDFKGVYCAVAGKGIAKRFTNTSDDYVIRYVRENPRTATDAPDAFESAALARFESGESEYYKITEYDGSRAFRYSWALSITKNCLECHGDPAGEPDVTGFLKEGMRTGDLAGAVSIVIPLDDYVAEAQQKTLCSVIFFVLLALTVVAIVRFALKRWVTNPLENANRQLQDESDEKSNFLAIMSHELRTPLSSIIAFTEIWESSDREKDDEERKLVGEIKVNSISLLNMVNNTIDVARLEAGTFELACDDVDLIDVFNVVHAVAEPLCMKKGIELRKAVDPSIPIMRSDYEALCKILMNLVGNAVKFTEQGFVSMSATFEAKETSVLVTVSDTGRGIAEGDSAAIFGRFSRPKSRGSDFSSGSGLGLFLVKNLVERLGGDIVFESRLNGGSSFSVILPIETVLKEEVTFPHAE